MVDTNIRAVQGFYVDTFTVKKEKIKVVLNGNKDDIRAGDGDVGDVLKSLELHSTAADSTPVSASLLRDFENTDTDSYDLTVVSFTVKQDFIKLVLEVEKEDEDEGGDLVKSLAVHSARGEEGPVELIMARADI